MSNSSKFRKSAELLSAVCGSLLMGASVIPQAVLAQQPTNQQQINQTTSQVNPCPRIFYEAPHNNQVAVPQGCPPNAYTQQLIDQGQLNQSNVPANPTAEQIRLGVGGEAGSATNPNPTILNEAPYNRSQSGLQPQGSVQPETTQPSVTPASQTPTDQSVTPYPSQQQSPSARIATVNGRVNIRLVNDTAATVTYQVIGDTAPRSLPGKSNVTLQGLAAPVTVTFQREDGGLLQATPQTSSQSGQLEVRLKETTSQGQDRRALRIENNGSVFLN
ncbi:hypothetical protein [Nostoc sp. MS1]|uniref:hypothetical protein n=1 Tax=Nostoc sp. MS1 TaxID=2764711 RepID=UPI001CC5BB48|nr:hypothetical protein [Nostoc sp. MS1]BCL36953.1 hypothetical protein NSMS1_34000 [Nostoc sp. MS1]